MTSLIGKRIGIDCEAGPWPTTHDEFMADRTQTRKSIRSYGVVLAEVPLKGCNYFLVEFENGIKREFENIGGMTYVDKLLIHPNNMIVCE